MRTKIITLIIFAIQYLGAAPDPVRYCYDAAGNRVKREIVFTRMGAPQQPGGSSYYMDDLADDCRIKIYVGPSNGIIHIETLAPDSKNEGTVVTYNMGGKQLMASSIDNGCGHVNLGGYPSGVYLLKNEIDGNVTTWKVRKQ